jgi:pseudaminic acid synthase
MRIGGIEVGLGQSPFVIAEMSGNHNGSFERALRIVDAAAAAGATALKLQTYTADTMTLDSNRPGFVIEEPTSLWYGRKLYDLYGEAHTPWEWHPPIMQRARELGLLCFSSPFDASAVAFLEELDVPCYKIASLENVDHPLIQTVAATGKPMIISTGASTLQEVDEAVEVARDAGCHALVVLRCISGYPAPPDDANLRAIPMLRQRYGCEVGLSDHSLGIGVAIAAVALGATVIEKHLVEDRAAGGIDAAFSMEPDELARLIEEADRARRSLGTPNFVPAASEAGARTRRRSLYITEDLEAGDELTVHNLRSIRPGFGLHPKHHDELIGQRVVRALSAGTPADWALIGRAAPS